MTIGRQMHEAHREINWYEGRWGRRLSLAMFLITALPGVCKLLG